MTVELRPPKGRRFGAVLALLALAALLIVPSSGAGAAAGGNPRAERERVRRERAQVAAELDALRATDRQVEAALDALEANVAQEQARLADARQAADQAAAEAAAALAAEQRTAEEIAVLEQRMTDAAVQAYMRAGTPTGDPILSSADPNEAVVREALIDQTSVSAADVRDQMRALHEDLGVLRAAADQAAERAAAHRDEVTQRVASLEQAERQQRAVVAEIDGRIEAALAESAALAQTDQRLAKQIADEQARWVARTRAVARSSTGGAVFVSGGRVPLATVRGITVHRDIADNLEALLAAAEADGIVFGGGGYRDPEDQWRLRRAHCPNPSSSPPSACRPPTARPGQSMHERGLAVDFTYNGSIISSRSNPGYRWLAAHAGSYGFRNLPSEPWHWSTNGQ